MAIIIDVFSTKMRDLAKWVLLRSTIVEWLHHQFPEWTGLLPLLVFKVRAAGDYESAIQIAQDILAKRPHSKKSWQILNLDPDCAYTVGVLGRYYSQIPDEHALREVLQNFVPGISIKPSMAFKIAFLMIDIHDYQAARDLLSIARKNTPNNFQLLASQIVCEISDRKLDEAVHLGREMIASEDNTRRSYFFYQYLVSMIDESDIDKEKYSQHKIVFRNRMKELISLPPSQNYVEWLRITKERVTAIRDTQQSIELIRDQPIQVSFICPIHRPADVENAIAQISRQTWRNAEAVFAINGGKISPEQIEALWYSDALLKIVDCNDLDRVGPVLNRAIQHSSGSLIIRIDADNIYMPEYAADAVLSIEHFEADMVGHTNGCRLLKDDGLVVADLSSTGFIKAVFGDGMWGGSLCFKRELFERVQFNTELKRAEDTCFVQQSISQGFSVHYAGALNYLSVRSDDRRDHTWNVSKAEILLGARVEILGSKTEIEKDVEFSIESENHSSIA